MGKTLKQIIAGFGLAGALASSGCLGAVMMGAAPYGKDPRASASMYGLGSGINNIEAAQAGGQQGRAEKIRYTENLKYPDGAKYTGFYVVVDGRAFPHGNGTMTDKYGLNRTGSWEYGTFKGNNNMPSNQSKFVITPEMEAEWKKKYRETHPDN